MDYNINNTFENILNERLIAIVISNSTDKERMAKIKIRPVLLKGGLYYQASEFIGNQVFHNNYLKEELIHKLPDWFEGLFRQAQISTKESQIVILVSKKGNATIKVKPTGQYDKGQHEAEIPSDETEAFRHNKQKQYILTEGVALGFLVDLGVMTKEGVLVKAKSDKFRQINRFLEYVEDILPFLEKEKDLTILDFGCGKSYLTFAMYYYLRILKGYHIHIIGLDLKKDVIANCNALSRKYGYEHLEFIQGDIASYEDKKAVDMVVTLHACDTATDHALYKAVTWGAKVILSVPCCQHELNGQMYQEVLQPVLKYGIVKERMAALITDALRAQLLETQGYRVQLLEFIDMEHTPKNILIRAVKRTKQEEVNADENLTKCMEFLGVSPCLKMLLEEKMEEEGRKC